MSADKDLKDEMDTEILSESENVSFDGIAQDEDSKDELQNSEVILLKESLLRATADFENIKKRLEREKSESVKFANESFARDLLPVLDALEIALNFKSDDEIANKIKDGVNLTLEQFKKCFEKYGIKEISTDIEFDPQVHNAINYIDDPEVKSGSIAQVYQKGYLYNDRVLRPSMVVIAK